MKLTLLGTDTPGPSLKRMSSGYVVEVGEDTIIFDHGPGAHHRFLESGRRAVDVTHCFFYPPALRPLHGLWPPGHDPVGSRGRADW